MSRSAPIRPARETLSDAGDASRAPADLVDEIASELNLLSQSHRNPEAFLERRDMLVKRLRRLAKRMGSEPARACPSAAPAAPYRLARAGQILVTDGSRRRPFEVQIVTRSAR